MKATIHPPRLQAYLLCLFLINPFIALSWGVSGHRIIGEIAERQLTDTAQRKIAALLNNATIAMVSNWGDEIRSDPAYDHTTTWHYTNLAPHLTRTDFTPAALSLHHGQNIHRIIRLTQDLKQQPNDPEMLKMLIHLVGDLHCPLHLGRLDDRGGNSIPITWFNSQTNLHSLWDSGLIDNQKLSYTEYANHLLLTRSPRPIPFDGHPDTILDWAWTIYLRAHDVYTSAPATAQPYRYIYIYKPLWETCLVEAATHLAALLNYIYNYLPHFYDQPTDLHNQSTCLYGRPTELYNQVIDVYNEFTNAYD
jgi:hypothetical protein